MALQGSRPQFSKLGPATKMALQVDSSNFFHSKRIKIDDKKYNDPIWIIETSIQSHLIAGNFSFFSNAIAISTS